MQLCALGMVVFSSLLVFVFIEKPETNDISFFYGCWSVTIILLLIDMVITQRIVTIPKREQLRYYEQAGLKPLSLEQRQALQLSAVSDYSDGFWTETLEYYPLRKRVKDDDYPYRSSPLIEPDEYQSQIYSDWRIETKEEYTKVLHQLWAGMHSQRFLAVMNDDSKAATTAANLAELVKEPEQYVRNCIEQRGKRPPALVWGFDLWRALVLSSNCFSADLISEHQAWRDILKTARYAHGLF